MKPQKLINPKSAFRFDNEAFYAIPDFPGYFISKSARILSKITSKTKFLKVSLNNVGYTQVALRHPSKKRPPESRKKGNVSVVRGLHYWMAKTFIENPEGFREVGHHDDNKLNNSIYNLYWCDHAQNMAHAALKNRMRHGELSPHAKLSDADVEYIRSYPRIRGRNLELAAMFKVDRCTIAGIRTGSLRKKKTTYGVNHENPQRTPKLSCYQQQTLS